MQQEWDFRIRFWGARGTFSTPLLPDQLLDRVVESIRNLLRSSASGELSAELDANRLREMVTEHVPFHVRSTFGGNTTCIEVETPDQHFIVDAGSGLCPLGAAIASRWSDPEFSGKRHAVILLSHAHMDHVFAIPFVDTLYDPHNEFHIWAQEEVVASLNAVLGPSAPLGSLYVPPTFAMMKGIKQFRRISAGEAYQIGGTTVRTFALNHPGGCLAFRFERGDRSIVLASDHEQTQTVDEGLVEFCRGADLLYADAQYYQSEYQGSQGIDGNRPLPRKGWGHSSVESAIETALAAQVKRLYLGHHDPKRSDQSLQELESHARRHLGEVAPDSPIEVCMTREGASLAM